MLSEHDWELYLKARESKRDTKRIINTDFLRQAAVSNTELTGHPAWDHYLQKLQVMVEDTEKEIASIHTTLATPIAEETLRLGYVALNVLTERIRVLKQCMSLPKEIVSHAAEHGLIADSHA